MKRFRLTHARILRVAVWQQAPRCLLLGRYVVRADRGANVLRLPRRVGKHAVVAGTYRFVATSRGATVLDVRVRVVRTKRALLVRRTDLVDRCPAPATMTAAVTPFAAPATPPPAPPAHATPKGHGNPFLPPVIRNLNPAKSALARAILFALLGCAIALFTAASVVSKKRAAITVTGVVLLVAAAFLALFA